MQPQATSTWRMRGCTQWISFIVAMFRWRMARLITFIFLGTAEEFLSNGWKNSYGNHIHIGVTHPHTWSQQHVTLERVGHGIVLKFVEFTNRIYCAVGWTKFSLVFWLVLSAIGCVNQYLRALLLFTRNLPLCISRTWRCMIRNFWRRFWARFWVYVKVKWGWVDL